MMRMGDQRPRKGESGISNPMPNDSSIALDAQETKNPRGPALKSTLHRKASSFFARAVSSRARRTARLNAAARQVPIASGALARVIPP
jgi:hypothetical protein